MIGSFGTFCMFSAKKLIFTGLLFSFLSNEWILMKTPFCSDQERRAGSCRASSHCGAGWGGPCSKWECPSFCFCKKSYFFPFTFSVQRFFFGLLYVVDLKLIVSLSHSFLFLISQILQILFLFNPILNPIFLSFHSSAGEKVKKQLSSLPRSLSAQFYQLTRKPGVEEVVQKL